MTRTIIAFLGLLVPLAASAQDVPEAAPVTVPVEIRAAPAASGSGPASVLIAGGKVHTLGADGTIEGGDVLISGGKIVAVGRDLVAPEGAQVVNARDRIVTPGLMTSYSQLGITEIELVRETADVETSGKVAEAAFDVADAINPNSTLIPITRIEGITRALVAPLDGPHVFAGQAAIIHLGNGPDLVVKRRAGMFAFLGPVGGNMERYRRPESWAAFREAIAEAREYQAMKAEAGRIGQPRDQRNARIDLEALLPVIAGEEPLVVYADRASDIRQALAFGAAENVKLVILGGTEAWEVAKELADAKVPVLIDPEHNLPQNFGSLGSTLANAKRLDEAGVTVAFSSASEQYAHNARRMGQLAGNAVANGMPYERALAAITKNPAEIWGIADTYGTLEAGKDADVVVWDGDPLETGTAPVAVFIKGERMALESRQSKLRERYRDLSQKNPPFGYR